MTETDLSYIVFVLIVLVLLRYVIGFIWHVNGHRVRTWVDYRRRRPQKADYGTWDDFHRSLDLWRAGW